MDKNPESTHNQDRDQARAASLAARQADQTFRPVNPAEDDVASYNSRISSYKSRASGQTQSSRHSVESAPRSVHGENFWGNIDYVMGQPDQELKKYFDDTIGTLANSAEAIDDMPEYKAAIAGLLGRYYHAKSAGNQTLEAILFYTIQDTTQNLINRGGQPNGEDSFRILFIEQPELIRFIHDNNIYDHVVEQNILNWVQDHVNPDYDMDGALQVIENCRRYNADFGVFDENHIEGLLRDWRVHEDDIENQAENLNIRPLAKLRAPQIDFGSQRRSEASAIEPVAEGDQSFGSYRASDHSFDGHGDDSYTGDHTRPSLDDSTIYPERMFGHNPNIHEATAHEAELQADFDELSIHESLARDPSEPRASTPIPQATGRTPSGIVNPQTRGASPVANQNPQGQYHK